jgi:general secretion pathway protein F
MTPSNTYQVRYVDVDLRIQSVRVVAVSAEEARLLLPTRSTHVLKVQRELREARAANKRFSRDRNIEVTRALLGLLRPGLAVLPAVEIAGKEATTQSIRQSLEQIEDGLRSGASLSRAMADAGHFDPLLVASIAAAEPSGRVVEALERWLEHTLQWQRLSHQIRAALTYPIIVIGVAVLVMAFLLLFLLPKFATIFEDTRASLPWVSVALFRLSQFVRGYSILLLAVACGAIATLAWMWRTGRLAEFVRRWVMVVPMARKVALDWQLARFYRAAALLLASGVPLLRAIAIINDSSPSARLDDLAERIATGDGIVDALLASGLTTESGKHLLAMGEQSGNLSQTCTQVADLYEERFSRRIALTMRIAEPLLMLLLSLFVGAMVVSMYLPIFDLASSVR